MRLADRLEKPILEGFVYFLDPSLNRHLNLKEPRYREKFLFILDYLFLRWWSPIGSPTLNFLVTSEAEIRVYSPIIKKILEQTNVSANIYFLSRHEFSRGLRSEISRSSNVSIPSNLYPLVKSCLKRKQWVNVICLDHKIHKTHHSRGIEAVRVLNLRGGKTVCLQHGSTRSDNIEGHISSESQWQVVWGEIIYHALLADRDWSRSNVFLTGNPLHDRLHQVEQAAVKKRFRKLAIALEKEISNKRILLLATCLHSEYDHLPNSAELYKRYISTIYDSINFREMFLLVKMHPLDMTCPNLYLDCLPEDKSQNVLVLEPHDEQFDFYDLLCISDLLLTRASTTAEEALLLGKPVIAFDILSESLATQLRFLKEHPRFFRLEGSASRLATGIDRAFSAPRLSELEQEEFVRGITYKLDGQSTNRVVERLIEIAGN